MRLRLIVPLFVLMALAMMASPAFAGGPPPVPEPSSIVALGGLAVMGLIGWLWRTKTLWLIGSTVPRTITQGPVAEAVRRVYAMGGYLASSLISAECGSQSASQFSPAPVGKIG